MEKCIEETVNKYSFMQNLIFGIFNLCIRNAKFVTILGRPYITVISKNPNGLAITVPKIAHKIIN
jgi:endonuclease V-like protein UPF0215 family